MAGMNTPFQKGTAYKESSSALTFFNGVAVAEIPEIETAPLVNYAIKIVVSGGTDNSGTIIITGTQAGSEKSETITITAAGTYYSVEYFDLETVPTITTTGLHDEDTPPNLVISPVTVEFKQAIKASERFSVDWISETVEVRDATGDITRFDSWFTTDPSLSVGDHIQYNSQEFTIEKVIAVKLLSRTVDHYKCYVS